MSDIDIVEIKAKSSNQGTVRDILTSKNAIFKGVDHQIDTYFMVTNGKLKCWGGNTAGELGLEKASPQGDQIAEMGNNFSYYIPQVIALLMFCLVAYIVSTIGLIFHLKPIRQ